MNGLVFDYCSATHPANIKKENFSFEKFDRKMSTTANEYAKNNGYIRDVKKYVEMIIENKQQMGNILVESYRKNYNATYDCYHTGYLHYLYTAYMQDLGIEIAPWYLWNVIFHQIAQIIKNDGDKFKHLFTKSEEKINLSFVQDEINITQYTNCIKALFPNENDFDTFFPNWSQTPTNYNESMQGLFADMVQNYYGCFILGCSMPAANILGTQEDWTLLHNTVVNVNKLLNVDYLHKVSKYTDMLQQEWNKKETWKQFFVVGNCGSGSQECICGDIRKLLNYGNHEMLVSALPNTMSKFPFINENNNFLEMTEKMSINEIQIDTNIINCHECFYNAGIAGSNIETIDGIQFLIPKYDYAITFIDKRKFELKDDQIAEYKDFQMKYDQLMKLKVGRECINSIWFNGSVIGRKHVLTQNLYDRNKHDAKQHYEFLFDKNACQQFYKIVKSLNQMCSQLEVDIINLTIHTLDVNIYQNIFELSDEKEKQRLLRGIEKLCAINHNYAYEPIPIILYFKLESSCALKDELNKFSFAKTHNNTNNNLITL